LTLLALDLAVLDLPLLDLLAFDLTGFDLPRDLRFTNVDEVCSTAGGNDAWRSPGTIEVRSLLVTAAAFEKPGRVPVLSARGGEEEGRASSPVGCPESKRDALGAASAGGFALTV
jgi:hypothetical protein